MRGLLAMLAATLSLGPFVSSVSAQEVWKPEGVSITAWPSWCSRVGLQSGGLLLAFSFEATPCGQSVPVLTILQAPPPSGPEPVTFEDRFRSVVEQMSGPQSKAYHLAKTIQMNGPCTQVSHEVNANPLPGLHAYEIHSVHDCQRFVKYADTRNLNILVPREDGGAWIITLDHPYADLTQEQDALLRRTAAELAHSN